MNPPNCAASGTGPAGRSPFPEVVTLVDKRWRSAVFLVISVMMMCLGVMVVLLPDIPPFGRIAMALLAALSAFMVWNFTMLLLNPGTLTLDPQHLTKSALLGTNHTFEWSRCGEFRLVRTGGQYKTRILGCQYAWPTSERRSKRASLDGINLQLGSLSLNKDKLCALLNQYRQDVLDAERSKSKRAL